MGWFTVAESSSLSGCFHEGLLELGDFAVRYRRVGRWGFDDWQIVNAVAYAAAKMFREGRERNCQNLDDAIVAIITKTLDELGIDRYSITKGYLHSVDSEVRDIVLRVFPSLTDLSKGVQQRQAPSPGIQRPSTEAGQGLIKEEDKTKVTQRAVSEGEGVRGCEDYIVKLLDVGNPPRGSEFKLPILEYVEGQSLRDFIEGQGRVSWDVLRHLMYELLYAVSCVHGKGIVHRDIRPGNVIVIPSNLQVKLIDFSTAKLENEDDGWVVEAPGGYTAPEQRLGKSSRRSDVYSLGATLLFMLTGEDPDKVKLSNPEDLASLISRRVTGVSDGDVKRLLAFIGRAMSENPQQRFADAVEMARVFHEVFYEGKELKEDSTVALQLGKLPEGCIPTGRKFHIHLTVMLMNGGRYERYEDKEFEVKDDELVVIGREKHRGLVKVERKSKTIRVIINDPYQYVSRTHCVMYWCNGRWFVKDFSQNGTWVMDPTGSRRTYVRGESSKPVEVNNGDYLLLAYVTPNQPYVTIIFEYK